MPSRPVALVVAASLVLSACASQIASVKNTKACQRVNFLQYSSCIKTELDKAAKGTPSDLTQSLKNKINSLREDVRSNIITDEVAFSALDNTISALEKEEKDENSKKVALGILAGVAVAGAAYAVSKSGGGKGYVPTYNTPLMCSAAPYGSKPVCYSGKACGDTCIDASETCRVGRGTACNTQYRTYP